MNEKLTAYALNEMPPDERAAFEAELQRDPALREQAEQMKGFCQLLNDNVTKPDKSALTSGQREDLIKTFQAETTKSKKIVHIPFWKHPYVLSSAAMAACLAVVLVKYVDVMKQPDYVPAASESVAVLSESKDRGAFKSPTGQGAVTEEEIRAHLASMQHAVVPSGGTSPMASPDKAKALADFELAQTKKSVDNVKQKVMELPASPPLPTPEPAPQRMAAKKEMAQGGLGMGSGTSPIPAPVTRSDSASSDDALGGGRLLTSNAPAGPPPASAPAAGGKERSKTFSTVNPSPPLPAAAPMASTAIPGQPMVVDRQVAPDEFGDKDESRRQGGAFGKVVQPPTNESYTVITENPFLTVGQQPLSTFSIDVDTASYANVRRFLNDGQRPPADAVRLEELINYFPYSYESPGDDKPFAVTVDMAEAPWQPLHRLARVALKGKELGGIRGAANFVFLVDISGSMNSPDKLPLVKQSLRMLVDQLREDDRVAIVTYAGESGIVLESTLGSEKEKILSRIEAMRPGGSTNGASGIRLAYDQATANFQKNGVNRVILCTDGDFNVGVSSPEELQTLITDKAKTKVFLSVLGYGTGNLKDRTMENLADKGNGNYSYIDSASEARKVLVEQMQSTLVTIAKDVKIQIEFNPKQVAAYRLLGYENRILAKEDFNNDKKDAGEIGAGHTVTALYEIVPANLKYPNGKPAVDSLKYAQTEPAAQAPAAPTADAAAKPAEAGTPEAMTVKLRYKQPEGDQSTLIEVPVTDTGKKMAEAPRDFQFAAGVAGFGMLLRNSPNAADLTWDMVRDLAGKGKGEDPQGYRGEFLQLIEKARSVAP